MQKHSNRPKSAFKRPISGKKSSDYSEAGQSELRKILESTGRIVRKRKGGIEYRYPTTGKGVQFNKDGTMSGFLEPNKPTL